MAISPRSTVIPGIARDHAFHVLTVREIVRETGDAHSFVFDIPSGLQALYDYEPGQFLTFRIWIDGQPHLRCYSMSSAPCVDGLLAVTVKRVRDRF
jgi:3-ketosteroid 9alpha-monooxygenase subunit B